MSLDDMRRELRERYERLMDSTYKVGVPRRGEFTLMGVDYEFEEQRFASIEPSKDFPSEYDICSGERRWEWEKGKPETKKEAPTTRFCAHVPKHIFKKMVKEVDPERRRLPLDSDVWKAIRKEGLGLASVGAYWVYERGIGYVLLKFKRGIKEEYIRRVASAVSQLGYDVRIERGVVRL